MPSASRDSKPRRRGAERVIRPKVGLALGGGLPFGAASIGILEVFEKHRVPIDCIAGTSMGSIVGALYAYGYSPRELENLFEEFFAIKRLLPTLLRDLRFSRSGFVQGREIIKAMARFIPPSTRFEDLRIPFAVPAADLTTGQELVFRSGPVLPAIRASISMPGIFKPVRFEETYLVDGAVISPVPVHLLHLLGADIQIPIRAVRKRPGVPQRSVSLEETEHSLRPHHGPPDVLRLMWRSLSLILQDRFAEHVLDQYPLHLKPEIPFDRASNPKRVGEIIDLGRGEAEKRMGAIQIALRGPARHSARMLARDADGSKESRTRSAR